MRLNVDAAICAALLAAAMACLGRPAAGGETPARVGFEESFDTADGWQVAYGAPLKSMTSRDGAVRFETVCGALNPRMKRADWPEWPEKPFDSNTGVKKDYGRKIDLNVYRYLVVKLDERGTMVKLAVAGSWTPVCYTTGLRAFDLKPAGITGARDLSLTVEFLNTSGVGTFDFVRLVSELTDEERAVLIPEPAEYFDEKRSAHLYHGLETLNSRAGRPRLAAGEGQLAVYRDTVSGCDVWRLGAQPGDQSLGDGWSEEGRFFCLAGGRDGRSVWDYGAAEWRATRLAGGSEKPLPQYADSWPSRNHLGVTYGYRTSWHRPECDFIFTSFDAATGEEKEFARFTSDGKWDVRELAAAEKGDRAAVGLRGTPNVWIIDPEGKTPGERARYVKLNTRLKGLSFARDDACFTWANCYTYEIWQMNIATGEASLGYYTGGGHAGGGFGRTLRHYTSGMTVVQPSGLTDWKAGDLVKVFAYLKRPIETDYGRLVDGGRWWLVNGASGDVGNQHLMVDGEDCATILRLCGYNTSRNDWPTNTYSACSPDATKVAWVSDQLGDGDVYYVAARRPDPVRNLTAKGAGGELALAWEASERSKETAGYVVYGAGADGFYRLLGGELVKETRWTGKPPAGCDRFIVCAREWSGLEGLCPQPATTGGVKIDVVHLDVATAERSKTARLVEDGGASGFRCVRSFAARADEAGVKATVTWKNVALPAGAGAAVFMRARFDDTVGDWTWTKLTSGYETGEGFITVEVPAGRLVDKVVVSSRAGYEPKGLDDRFTAPEPPAGAKAEVDARGVVTLSWTKPEGLGLSRVEVFAGEGDFPCDYSTAIGAVPAAAKEQRLLDWGLKPGSSQGYALVAADSRGNWSGSVFVAAQIPAAQAVEIRVGPEGMKPSDAVEKVERNGEQMLAPKVAAAKDKPDPADFVALDVPFDLPVAGSCGVWVRYAPGYTDRRAVQVKLDGKDIGSWTVRSPFRPMSGALARPSSGKVKVFADRLVAAAPPGGAADLFDLAAGGHTLTLLLDPTIPGGNVHAIGAVWITNDPHWRPEGFDPRADFGK